MLILATPPASAFAGSIGFRTDAQVKAGPGIDAKVTVTHTGDEAAENVNVRAEVLDRAMDGAPVPSIAPGQSHVWDFHLIDEIPPGVYAVVLTTRYADANGYPFEVVSTATAPVGVKPVPRIFGSFTVPRLTGSAEATGRFTAKRPAERSGNVEVRFVIPSGLTVTPDHVTLEFDSTGKATAEVRVRNVKLLAGTSVNVFGFVTGTDAGFPQVDIIRGSVSIGAAATRVTSPMFYQAAAAVFFLLLLLEGIAWARARRSGVD